MDTGRPVLYRRRCFTDYAGYAESLVAVEISANNIRAFTISPDEWIET